MRILCESLLFTLLICSPGIGVASYFGYQHYYAEVDLSYYKYIEDDYKTHPELVKAAMKDEYLSLFEYRYIKDAIQNETGYSAKLRLLEKCKD